MKRPLCTFCLILCTLISLITLLKGRQVAHSLPDNAYTSQNSPLLIKGNILEINFKTKNGQQSQSVLLKAGDSKVLCYLSEVTNDLHIGEEITLLGKVGEFTRATNPGQFDQKLYYSILHIDYPLYKAQLQGRIYQKKPFKDSLYQLRRYFSKIIDDTLPAEEASLMKTMLLGETGELDAELKDLYQRNGIAHVLAISGLHISLLGLGIFKLLKKISPSIHLPYIASLIIVLFYGALTGFSVSSLRAVFMFALSMLAPLLKRTYDALTAVSLAMFLIIIYEPLYIYHSGFVFSFGCIWGINLIIPLLVPERISKRKATFFEKSVFSALGMTIITLPIYYIFFYQLPIYAIFLNFLVIPIMAILVPSGILLIISGIIFLPLCTPFRILITGILGFFKAIALFSDHLPAHFYTPGKPGIAQIFLFLLLITVLVIFKKKINIKIRWALTLVGIMILTLRFNYGLNITFLDVGQGDSIFLRCCESRISIPGITRESTLLIDGGSSDVDQVGKYRIIPFLKHEGIMNLDAVVMTHPDEDHINGITELLSDALSEGIHINELIVPDNSVIFQNEKYEELANLALSNNIPIAYLKSGDILYPLSNSDCYRLFCISPSDKGYYSDTNEASLVLQIEYSDFAALLTGDIEGSGEVQMIESLKSLRETNTINQNINLLKAAHHGSRNSGSEAVLNEIINNGPRNDTHVTSSPVNSIAIISCGLNNKYGHPHEETLKRLNDAGFKIYETRFKGAIRVHTNGTLMKTSCYLASP